MRKTTYILIIAIIISLIIIATLSRGQEISIADHDIIITKDDDSISVIESISFDVLTKDTFNFSIQDGASDISVVISGETFNHTLVSGNTYSINISTLLPLDVEIFTIVIYYELNKDVNELEKTLFYDSSSLTITYDGIEIYIGSSLTSGSSLNVALQKAQPGKTITEIETKETIPTWFYIIIIVLIVLLLISFMRPAKKQKSPKIRETVVASEELLTTKKALLMSLLKDIEKQHRSKEISDDTYHKLKERYKQETVEAMKQLEDMKS